MWLYRISGVGILTNRYFLWLLFWCNAVGTVYGYIWYGEQMKLTLAETGVADRICAG